MMWFMIRSRDLILFVGILFLLCVGIAGTVIIENKMELLANAPASFNFNIHASTTFTASADKKVEAREANIERLRKALAQNQTVITPHPSVESAPIDAETAMPDDDTSLAASITVEKCPSFDDGSAQSRMWPLSDVFVIVKDGTRSVVHITEKVALQGSASSSSSTPSVAIQTLLEMKAFPVAQGSSACLNSELIGITTAGSLMFNGDASLYHNRSADELLGYARDGFPIYGSYDGETDSCGGYTHPQGYRYSISANRNFVLGCYRGVPSSFEAL